MDWDKYHAHTCIEFFFFFFHIFSHISVNSIFILVTISTDSFVSSFTALSKLDVLLFRIPASGQTKTSKQMLTI